MNPGEVETVAAGAGALRQRVRTLELPPGADVAAARDLLLYYLRQAELRAGELVKLLERV